MSHPSPIEMADIRGRLWVAVLIVGIGISIALSAYALGRVLEYWSGDYLTYVGGARRLLEGNPLYPDFQLEHPFLLGRASWGAGYVYPPPSALLGIPFALLGEPYGFAVFTTVAGIALGVVVYAIGLREGLSARGATLLVALFLSSGPTLESILTGQANTFVAVGLGLAWLLPPATGYIAVVGGLIKLFPGALFAWTLRHRAPIVRPLAVGAALLAVSIVVFGVGPWFDFAKTMANGQPASFRWPEPPRHVLEPILGPVWASLATYVLAGLMLLTAIRVRSPYLAFLLMAWAMIMSAPDWYLHYLVIPLMGITPWIASSVARRRGLPRRQEVVST